MKRSLLVSVMIGVLVGGQAACAFAVARKVFAGDLHNKNGGVR